MMQQSNRRNRIWRMGEAFFHRHPARGGSVVEEALRVQLGEMFLLRRLLFLGHYSRAEIFLGGGDAAAELNIDADIAHRHFRPGKSAENHEVVEIAEMADPEHLARDLRKTGAE